MIREKNSQDQKITESFTTHTLDNGLTVLLKEIHSAPVISQWVWYRVGSRNEVLGKTGISHWVEHMLFKGTERFSEQEISQAIYRNGGDLNGSTYWDWTEFHETMPANQIGIALEMEADRMVNSRFDSKDVESERTVILSEKEEDDGDAMLHLMNSVRKAAFPHHPYGREIIGETEDLHGLTRDDLYEYYRTWYAPNNAVVSIAGYFETEEMLRQIEVAYGNIPARQVPSIIIPPEEPIQKPLRVEEHGPGDLTDLRISWHVPNTKDPDVPALTLLNTILAGAVSMNTFEKCSISNRTSRLFQKLVNDGMAADVALEYTPSIDPYLVTLLVPVSSGVTIEEVSDIIFEEYKNIARKGVLPAEIEKARRQAKAMFAYSTENIAIQAQWMGFSSMFADPAWYADYLQRLGNVKAEDISRIAGTLFRRDNCVIGVFSAEEE